MEKNLGGKIYSQKILLNTEIENLYKAANNDAYKLSMPLIASAIQGNEKLYQQILAAMNKALNNISESKQPGQTSYKSWLLGRVLLAADSINDQKTFNETRRVLKKLLLNTDQDIFAIWALGYLAGADIKDYKIYKNKLIVSIWNLSHAYEKLKINNPENSDTKTSQTALSNALWMCVMDLQAAANANDRKMYDFILNQTRLLTRQDLISEALSKGLLRMSDSNDYPAWAMSIVRLSAAAIGDEALYKQLKNPVELSIQQAYNAKATAEEILAKLNNILAKSRYKQTENQIVKKITHDDYVTSKL